MRNSRFGEYHAKGATDAKLTADLQFSLVANQNMFDDGKS